MTAALAAAITLVCANALQQSTGRQRGDDWRSLKCALHRAAGRDGDQLISLLLGEVLTGNTNRLGKMIGFCRFPFDAAFGMRE